VLNDHPHLNPLPPAGGERKFTKVTIIIEYAGIAFSPSRGEKKRGGESRYLDDESSLI